MRRLLWGVMSLAMLGGLAGCEAKTAVSTSSSGTLALSRDDALLYAVDTDNEALIVLDREREEKVAQVKLGRAPERILVGPDDTLYVANRGSRSVSVIRRGQWEEAASLEVGVEPVSLAVSRDEKTLYVVNSTSLEDAETGTLMAFDTQTLTRQWELAVGEEPRAIALLDGNRALISLYKEGDVVLVDLSGPEVIQAGSDLYEQANRSGSQFTGRAEDLGGVSSGTFRARAIADLAVSSDGKVYGPALWASEAILDGQDRSLGGGGGSYGGGPCFGGGVASAGLITFEGSGAEPRVDPVRECFQEGEQDFPASVLRSTDGSPVQGPVAAVVDPTGTWVYVVNRESQNVAIVPASRPARGQQNGFDVAPAPLRLALVGAGASGIALTSDGSRAYVYNSFDHSISVLGSQNGAVTNLRAPIVVAEDVLPQDVVVGRKLFFTAVDSRMNASTTSIACSSCHLEGREDGHVWRFQEGPRQTPSLAGRMTTATAPFHWNGEFATLADFLGHTVRLRMGGAGATEVMETQLRAYIDSLEAPDNPHRRAVPTDAQVRGAVVFEKANCQSCHAGAALTNDTFANVGTFVSGGENPDDPEKLARGLNTPSILALARTGPFLHDGSARTLGERLRQGREANLHGLTAQLSDAELDDLVEYLKSL